MSYGWCGRKPLVSFAYVRVRVVFSSRYRGSIAVASRKAQKLRARQRHHHHPKAYKASLLAFSPYYMPLLNLKELHPQKAGQKTNIMRLVLCSQKD
jgi:hypothetical protein